MALQNNTTKHTPRGLFHCPCRRTKAEICSENRLLEHHPLFKMLLEEAEMEYGFDIQGPIQLPCDVEFFRQVLAEIENADETSDCRKLFKFNSF